jgi:predicted nuclease with TOPRIM domain
MTVKTISRNLPLVDAEIRALNALIGKRTKWLEDPINRSKRTYSAVKADTDQMKEKLAELMDEKNKMLKPNTY